MVSRFVPPFRLAVLGLLLSAAPASKLAAQALPDAASIADPIPAGDTRTAANGAGADRFVGLRESIRRLVESDTLPSVAVAVSRHGEILWQEAFGWADVERRIPATPATPYSVASITKPMTATAILLLAERGLIDLERPVNDYLPAARIRGLAGDAEGATVRRVLDHTAGLPLHYAFFYEGNGDPARGTDEGIARYGVLVNPPGAVHEYSNLGYGILDRVVEHVTGRGYAEFMRDEIFAPLGMERSSVGTGAGLSEAAVRYDPRRRPIPPYDFDHRGGSAVFASVLDLVRFGEASLPGAAGPRLLTDATQRAMQQRSASTPAGQGYGLGWQVAEDDGGFRRVSHTGGMPGVTTALFLFPDQGVVVAAVTNLRDRAALRIAEAAAAAVLPGYADSLRAQRAGPVAALRLWAEPGPELVGDWEGHVHTHEGAVPLTLRVRRSGEVQVRLGDAEPTPVEQGGFGDGHLIGHFAGTIPTEDARRHPHAVRLDLRLRDGLLAGQATAMATTQGIHFALGSYVELQKRPAGRRR
jgi:CubicO group peptidase (beta-lactamase class C family)